MVEKRDNFRSNVSVPFKVHHESFGTLTVNSRNLSVGGIFAILDANNGNLPEAGSVINVQVLGDIMMGTNEIDAEVVRVEDGGFGLKFLYPLTGEERTH